MGVAEWKALSWWEQRVLAEGLFEEFSDPDNPDGQAPTSGSIIFDGKPGEMAAAGFRERNL